MSRAFPKELLAKSGTAPIMCARSRASKLDDISAKASVEVLRRGHAAVVPGRSPSRGRAMAVPGRRRPAAESQNWGCPQRQGGTGRGEGDEKSPLWGLEARGLHFWNNPNHILHFNKNHLFPDTKTSTAICYTINTNTCLLNSGDACQCKLRLFFY